MAMDVDQKQRILGYFLEEAKEHLSTLEQGLLNFQETLSDPEMMNELFRAAHSIKGGSAMLELTAIQKVSSRLEEHLKAIKERPQAPFGPALPDLLQQVVGALQFLLEQVEQHRSLPPATGEPILAKMRPVLKTLEQTLVAAFHHLQPVPTPALQVRENPLPNAIVSKTIQTGTKPTEESALHLIFKSDIPSHLRQMLELFKQRDDKNVRAQLVRICDTLERMGEQFELTEWCELVGLARLAIINSSTNYPEIGAIVLRDFKQAQSKVLNNAWKEIQASADLLKLLPKPSVSSGTPEKTPEHLIDLDFVTNFNADLASQEPFIMEDNLDFDLGQILNELDQSDLPDPPEVSFPPVPVRESLKPDPTHSTGSVMGVEDFNTLADLFEGNNPPFWNPSANPDDVTLLEPSKPSSPEDKSGEWLFGDDDLSADLDDITLDFAEDEAVSAQAESVDELLNMLDTLQAPEETAIDSRDRLGWANPFEDTELGEMPEIGEMSLGDETLLNTELGFRFDLPPLEESFEEPIAKTTPLYPLDDEITSALQQLSAENSAESIAEPEEPEESEESEDNANWDLLWEEVAKPDDDVFDFSSSEASNAPEIPADFELFAAMDTGATDNLALDKLASNDLASNDLALNDLTSNDLALDLDFDLPPVSTRESSLVDDLERDLLERDLLERDLNDHDLTKPVVQEPDPIAEMPFELSQDTQSDRLRERLTVAEDSRDTDSPTFPVGDGWESFFESNEALLSAPIVAPQVLEENLFANVPEPVVSVLPSAETGDFFNASSVLTEFSSADPLSLDDALDDDPFPASVQTVDSNPVNSNTVNSNTVNSNTVDSYLDMQPSDTAQDWDLDLGDDWGDRLAEEAEATIPSPPDRSPADRSPADTSDAWEFDLDPDRESGLELGLDLDLGSGIAPEELTLASQPYPNDLSDRNEPITEEFNLEFVTLDDTFTGTNGREEDLALADELNHLDLDVDISVEADLLPDGNIGYGDLEVDLLPDFGLDELGLDELSEPITIAPTSSAALLSDNWQDSFDLEQDSSAFGANPDSPVRFDSLLEAHPLATMNIDSNALSDDLFADLDPSNLLGTLSSQEGDWGDLDSLLAAPSIPEVSERDGFSDLDDLLDDSTGGLSGQTQDFDMNALDGLLLDSPPANAVFAPDATASFNATPSMMFDSFDPDLYELSQLISQTDLFSIGAAGTQVGRRVNPAQQSMKVPVKQLDNLNNLVGEMVVNRNSLETDQERLRQSLDKLLYQVQQLSDVGQRLQDLYERSLLENALLASRQSVMAPMGSRSGGGHYGHQNQASHSIPGNENEEHFDALEMDRFSGFHLLSQEMIELIVRVRESASDIDYIVNEPLDYVARNFRQVTTQIQEGLTRARMVPFEQGTTKLSRGIREVSRRCGKQARLVLEGKETLIDKVLLEQLIDPMTHLVNNAVTHGIEPPEERSKAHKPPEGIINIHAFHQGNQTVLVVSDDGAGIDAERVRRKAVEKGLVSRAEAANLNELQLYDFLFHAGFSTKDQADDFSGRGVGMDVVRTSLQNMRGSINTDSVRGKGTTFTIRLPLTLSISKALCCISNRARIAFPMDGVEDMLDVPDDRVQRNKQDQPCIQWRDQLIPFRPLTELLRFNRQTTRSTVYGGTQDDDMLSIVILRTAGEHIALKVDRVEGEKEIVIKQLEGPIPKPTGIAGVTVMSDGQVMPIADVLELIDLAKGRSRQTTSTLWEQEPPLEELDAPHEPMVLIVDDSITVRELLSMTFSKSGYRVEQARDGQEAWEKLRSGLPCDIVFCDIEMPRMTGLELLEKLQRDTTLNQLPIAMLTSRGADRHRQMAIQLGARGYFTKPYLEEALLEAASRMLKGEVLIHAAAG